MPPGDKVMQVVNDYERDVFNGDLGLVARIDPEESEVVVRFDGRDVAYGFGELDELVLAYAITIHKSQGSEYPAVVIPLTTQHRRGHRSGTRSSTACSATSPRPGAA